MSECLSLSLELSGDPGTVEIGIKDAAQPDDGTETKVLVQITGQWQTYTIPLSTFTRVNLKRVYVLVEFVFSGPQRQVVRARNIKYTSAIATSMRVLPQFAFGGGWYSSLYFTNTSDQPLPLHLQFVGDDGKPLVVPALASSSADVSIVPRGTAFVEVPNFGPLIQGYVMVLLPDGVIGFAVLRQSVDGRGDQEAVVPLAGALGTASTLIWDDVAFVTAVALVNPSPVNAAVNITIRDVSGVVIGRSAVSLAPGSKIASVLRDFAGLSAIAGRRGSAEFSVTSGNVVVLGLRFDGQAFTSIPATER
jgi:hypothetical protein